MQVTNKEIEEIAHRYANHEYQENGADPHAAEHDFIEGAKWLRNRCCKWISVEDELPDNEERVAILYRYKDGPNLRTFIGEYDPTADKWRAALNDITVEYWMPLPEPPKK